jgi:hypothetical protein
MRRRKVRMRLCQVLHMRQCQVCNALASLVASSNNLSSSGTSPEKQIAVVMACCGANLTVNLTVRLPPRLRCFDVEEGCPDDAR